jgi:uncharacterized membrane protein YjgN (DUF898 family)
MVVPHESQAAPSPAIAQNPADATEFTRYPVEFTATSGEYFRIWIVNLALTIVTLGIYSAWAKVRKRRYLYGHTRIAGEGFEYRARPLPILMGRLIALALFLAVLAAFRFVPLFSAHPWLKNLAAVIGFVVVGPWIIVRSFRFNAFNAAYRNVRMKFDATYTDCLRVVGVYGWLLLVPILYPYLKRRLVEFAVTRHFYGTAPFALDRTTFWKPFIDAYAKAIVIGILAGLLVLVSAFLNAGAGERGAGPFLVGLVLFYAAFLLALAYLRARTINIVWNSISIGTIRFQSSLKPSDLMGIYFSNLAAIVLTLGLAIPWAVIRTHRYRASKTTVIAAGSFDSFVQGEERQVGAAGEEIGEMFDLDIAF